MDDELREKLIKDGILKRHNIEPYIKVKKMFETSNKVGIVHATGTGKSFIALQLMHDNPDKKIIYLVPRNGIGDQVEEHIDALNMSGNNEFSNVTIMTYQKLLQLSKEQLEQLDVDLIITDEFHRVGAPRWQERLNILIDSHPKLKIFGMTATPVRAKGTHDELDMSDEFFEGNIASTYSLAQAISDGVLPAPIYKGAVYQLEDKIDECIRKVNSSNCSEDEKRAFLANLEAAKRKVQNADSFNSILQKNLNPHGKYIIFCPRGKLEETIADSMKWFEGFIDDNDITKYYVYSKNPKESKQNAYEFYHNDDTSKLRIMFAMDMYDEGIHVPGLDGVIMMRTTTSEIKFHQQLGRALASGTGDKKPLILDLVNNYEYIKRLEYAVQKEHNTPHFYSYGDDTLDLSDILFDIEIENIDIYNMLLEVDERLSMPFDKKIEEYIEMLNRDLDFVPMYEDKNHRFSNGDLINQFWSINKSKIIEILNSEQYVVGYEVAKRKLEDKVKKDSLSNEKKIAEYIEMLNTISDFKPKSRDIIHSFSNGDLINQFWNSNKSKIIELLNSDSRYAEGYETAMTKIRNYSFGVEEKLEEYIEMLNTILSFSPIMIDTEHSFSNGDLINQFWNKNKGQIIERLNSDPRYATGYEKAKAKIETKIKKSSLSYEEKIAEYIEMLNTDVEFIPMSVDKNHSFSNGDLINKFWHRSEIKIIEKLNNDLRYAEGYERAKTKIQNQSYGIEEKIAEYIEMLNTDTEFKPMSIDRNHSFSNGDLINRFWDNNKTTIIERLNNDSKYAEGYERAKTKIQNQSFSIEEKVREYIEMLNTDVDFVPKSLDKEHRFSNGDLINRFWDNNKTTIIERLNGDSRYAVGYEIAKAKTAIYSLPKLEQKQQLELLKATLLQNQEQDKKGGTKK